MAIRTMDELFLHGLQDIYYAECLSVNKLNDLSDLCFGARREIGAADVDQREPRSLRPEQASLPK